MQQQNQSQKISGSYFFHQQYYPKTNRKNCRSYRAQGQQQDRHLCMSNHNRIQIYTLKNSNRQSANLAYHKSIQLFFNIRALQVIPSQHHQSDYIFIADQNGRFAIWRENQGFSYISDTINALSPSSKIMENKNQSQLQDQIFSGVSYHFNVKDTQGFIMFTFNHILVVLEFSIKTSGFIKHKITRIQITFETFRLATALTLSKNRHLVGFIQQKQQTRTLHFLFMKNVQKVQWSLPKINLVKVIASGNQIVLMTFNQVSIHKYLTKSPICTFKITQGMYNQISVIGYQKYIHLGKELCIFSKKSFQNFGEIKTSKQQSNKDVPLKQLICLQQCPQYFTIFLRRENFSISIVQVANKGYKIIKQINPLPRIFALKTNQQTGQLITFNAPKPNFCNISLVQKKTPTKLIKQQIFPIVIQKIWKIKQGIFIILSSKITNGVLKYNETLKKYEQEFLLPNQQILGVYQQYFVTTKGVYGINFIGKKITKIQEQNKIIQSAIIQGKHLIYLTQEQKIKIFSIQNQKIVKVYSSLGGIYIMCSGCLQNQIFYGKWSHLNLIYISSLMSLNLSNELNEKDQKQGILLPQQQIVSSIITRDSRTNHKSTKQIWIGLSNGAIYIYLYPKRTLLQKIESIWIGSVQLIKANNFQILAKIGQNYKIIDQYKQQYKCQSIDVDSEIQFIQYLDNLKSFICAKKNKISLIQNFINQPTTGVSVLNFESVSTLYCDVEFHKENIYIAKNFQIIVYDKKSNSELKKQSTSFKSVSFLSKLQNGLIIGGVNDIDHAVIDLLEWDSMKILFSIDLGFKKIPKSFHVVNKNAFLVCFDSILRLYQIVHQDEVKQLFSFNTDINIYSIDFNRKLSRIVICDPYRYICSYHLSTKGIVSLARVMKQNKVNDVSFIGNSILESDNSGRLGVVEYNLNQLNDIQKLKLTSSWEMYVGETVFCLSKNRKNEFYYNEQNVAKRAKQNDEIYYGTLSGYIGRIQTISLQQFKILKRAQFEYLKKFQVQSVNILSYKHWRRRNCTLYDKVIDQILIKKYLQEEKFKKDDHNRVNYQNIKRIYEWIKSKP